MQKSRTYYSQELRRAQRQGRRIVCDIDPYKGQTVVLRPRRQYDPFPWVLEAGGPDAQRFSGRDCRPAED